MGKKILVPCFDVIMIAFFYMDFTVFFSGKRRSPLHQNTAQGSFCPLQSYSKKTFRKNFPKSARKYKRNVLMPPGHPIILLKIELIQYGRRIGKKVYYHTFKHVHIFLSSENMPRVDRK